MEKKCCSCKKTKDIQEFGYKRENVSFAKCISCRERNRKYMTKYTPNHKEEKSEYDTVYNKTSIDRIIRGKLTLHKMKDTKKGRLFTEEEYINSDWIKNQLIKCDNTCQVCGKGLKLTGYEYLSKDQFSVDRIDNSLAHIKSNCRIICWGCNEEKH